VASSHVANWEHTTGLQEETIRIGIFLSIVVELAGLASEATINGGLGKLMQET
jgi:hypothetical protein